MQGAPWTTAVVASYSLGLGRWGSLQALLKSVWSDSYYTGASNVGPYRIASSRQTDLHLVWRSPEERWTVDAYVEHIENERERYLMMISTGLPDGLFQFSHVPPRMYGLRIAYEF